MKSHSGKSRVTSFPWKLYCKLFIEKLFLHKDIYRRGLYIEKVFKSQKAFSSNFFIQGAKNDEKFVFQTWVELQFILPLLRAASTNCIHHEFYSLTDSYAIYKDYWYHRYHKYFFKKREVKQRAWIDLSVLLSHFSCSFLCRILRRINIHK